MLISKEKIVTIFTILFLLVILTAPTSFAIVSQSPEFFVNDTANILSAETKEYIINMNKDLENQVGAQIVVVTVKSLDGLSVEDYALKLARSYRNW